METKKDILQALEKLLNESIRLYETNNKGPYEAGRIDGIKWAIETINKGY